MFPRIHSYPLFIAEARGLRDGDDRGFLLSHLREINWKIIGTKLGFIVWFMIGNSFLSKWTLSFNEFQFLFAKQMNKYCSSSNER